MSGWIGVDLDGTLAHYQPGDGVETIGEPIPAMVLRVQDWLAAGKEVRIVTARVAMTGVENDANGLSDDHNFATSQYIMIRGWTLKHIGQILPVTAAKDFNMIELWDDRAVRVIANTGQRCCHSD